MDSYHVRGARIATLVSVVNHLDLYGPAIRELVEAVARDRYSSQRQADEFTDEAMKEFT